MRRTPVTVALVLLVVVGVAGFIFFGFLAWLTICGISGCSGGGFGRSTDPSGTLTLLAVAGACLAVPLLLYAAWLRRARLAVFAVVAGIAGAVVLGLVIGSDGRGCPRNISYQTCLEESR
jgi:hypothetical protein